MARTRKADSTVKSIAVCYIATGPYIQFFNEFRDSVRKFFLPGFKKTFYVWSDTEVEECTDTVYTMKHWERWPEAAQYRFRTFLTREEELRKHDYVCFFNANSIVSRVIEEKDIIDPYLPFSSAVHMQMPYMEEETRSNWLHNAYWTNEPESPAFIDFETLRNSYGCWLMGGFQLGRANDFMDMCKTVTSWMELDRRAGRVLKWHDEPYFNKYAIDHGVKRLSPEYLYPEGYDIPAKENPAIIILDKVARLGREDFRHNARKRVSLIQRNIDLQQTK